MGHQINFIIDDDNWRYLDALPRGQRSRWVNQVLAEYRRIERRRSAAGNLDALSRSLPRVAGHAEDWVREDRQRAYRADPCDFIGD